MTERIPEIIEEPVKAGCKTHNEVVGYMAGEISRLRSLVNATPSAKCPTEYIAKPIGLTEKCAMFNTPRDCATTTTILEDDIVDFFNKAYTEVPPESNAARFAHKNANLDQAERWSSQIAELKNIYRIDLAPDRGFISDAEQRGFKDAIFLYDFLKEAISEEKRDGLIRIINTFARFDVLNGLEAKLIDLDNRLYEKNQRNILTEFNLKRKKHRKKQLTSGNIAVLIERTRNLRATWNSYFKDKDKTDFSARRLNQSFNEYHMPVFIKKYGSKIQHYLTLEGNAVVV